MIFASRKQFDSLHKNEQISSELTYQVFAEIESCELILKNSLGFLYPERVSVFIGKKI